MKGLPGRLCLSAILAWTAGVALAADETQQVPGTVTPAQVTTDYTDCALIEDGVKRLACYDSYIPPEKAQATVPPEQKQAVNQAVEQAKPKHSLLNALMEKQRELFSYSGGPVSYRPTYLMPFTWMFDPNQSPQSPSQPAAPYDQELDSKEIKFQLSFKMPLLTGMFNGPNSLWFAYTQRSFWQAYNSDYSAPFRETDYEPEAFLQHDTNFKIGPGTLDYVGIGIDHQSNGRSDPYSRSWNRLMGHIGYSTDNWLFIVRPWYRLPESQGKDDNPGYPGIPGLCRLLGRVENGRRPDPVAAVPQQLQHQPQPHLGTGGLELPPVGPAQRLCGVL